MQISGFTTILRVLTVRTVVILVAIFVATATHADNIRRPTKNVKSRLSKSPVIQQILDSGENPFASKNGLIDFAERLAEFKKQMWIKKGRKGREPNIQLHSVPLELVLWYSPQLYLDLLNYESLGKSRKIDALFDYRALLEQFNKPAYGDFHKSGAGLNNYLNHLPPIDFWKMHTNKNIKVVELLLDAIRGNVQPVESIGSQNDSTIRTLLSAIEASVNRGKIATLFVDIDDTVISSKHRAFNSFMACCLESYHNGMFKDLSFNEFVQNGLEISLIKHMERNGLPPHEISRHLQMVKNNIGFFSNNSDVVSSDVPFENIKHTLEILKNAGAQVVYLTARSPSQKSTTISMLESLGFPLDGIIFKPTTNRNDGYLNEILEYKGKKFTASNSGGSNNDLSPAAREKLYGLGKYLMNHPNAEPVAIFDDLRFTLARMPIVFEGILPVLATPRRSASGRGEEVVFSIGKPGYLSHSTRPPSLCMKVFF
tara:strand:+ start:56986 stop:58437 length:1452 start_codon:yes stop_codon:yes gene_type:complete